MIHGNSLRFRPLLIHAKLFSQAFPQKLITITFSSASNDLPTDFPFALLPLLLEMEYTDRTNIMSSYITDEKNPRIRTRLISILRF